MDGWACIGRPNYRSRVELHFRQHQGSPFWFILPVFPGICCSCPGELGRLKTAICLLLLAIR